MREATETLPSATGIESAAYAPAEAVLGKNWIPHASPPYYISNPLDRAIVRLPAVAA